MTFRVLTDKDSPLGDNQLNLRYDLEGEYSLFYFSTTNHIFNVRSTNNVLGFTQASELPATATVTIPEGNYTTSELAAAINDILVVENAGFSCTLNSSNDKLTITNSLNNFTLDFTQSEEVHKLLGHLTRSTTTMAASWTATLPINLNSSPIIYICLEQDERRNFQGERFFGQTFLISSKALFGEVIRVDTTENFPTQKVKIRKTRNLNISFVDKIGTSLNINDWILILKQ
jgi:hypothetical protein